MTKLLVKWFVRDYQNTGDPKVRAAYGKLGGIVGILLNLLLFAVKLTGAVIIGSVAVRADAFNNLSDAASSVIALVTVLISCKPADRHHPFGHARIEYVSSMIVSFLILLVGYDLAKDSVTRIFSPAATEYAKTELLLVLGILVLAVLCKLGMFFFFRKLGKMIDSEVLQATAMDSISDTAATGAVLLSTVISAVAGVDLDGYMGLLVAGFILFSGIKILNETKNSILGEAPTEETVAQIRAILERYPGVLGVHDMTVHSYGPHHQMVTLHAEVDGSKDVFETHDMVDNIERAVKDELHIDCTIHMDPIAVGDAVTDELRQMVSDAVAAVDPRIGMHDFRCVIGATHTNLIFDAAVPFEVPQSDEKLKEEISQEVHELLGDNYYCVITVDRG